VTGVVLYAKIMANRNLIVHQIAFVAAKLSIPKLITHTLKEVLGGTLGVVS
jgi:hypothetical protein